MALTRPRAYQIYDIDYKQAVRVIALTNVVLSGGAPNSVDNVNLSINDRILVAGQNNAAQNGIYYVTTLGTGANGTWSRSIDTDTTGELLAGTIVMVTEGTVFQDTQWKLITDNPIVIGTTPLIFAQNSAFAYGNVFANGTAVLATTVGDVLTLSAGNNISITGNNTSKTVTIGVTGISLNSISNGTSNVNVVSSGGNVTVGVGGTGNVAVFSATGLDITGDLNVSGNATLSGNILGDRLVNGTTSIEIPLVNSNANISVSGTSNVVVISPTGIFVSGVSSVSGNVTGGNLITSGLISASGNVTANNLIVDNTISAVGNIQGSYILGNGRSLTGINAFSTIAVSGQGNVVAESIVDTLTLVAGSGISIVTDAGNDSVTISQVATDSIFATGGDMGTISEAVTASEDLGLITSAATVEYDLGTLTTSGIITPSYLLLPSYTVSQLASLAANPAGQFVFCSNESGGSVPAFSDGTNWRRVTDRAIVS